MSWKAGARLRLPEATVEVLASIGEHRILSTAQVRAIHFPDRSPRRAQQVLAHLKRAGHSKIQTTFDVYGHLLPGSRDDVRERMDAYLNRSLSSRVSKGAQHDVPG